MLRIRLTITALVALVAMLVAGCGGGGDSDEGSSGSGSDSGSGLASLASPGSVVFAEADLKPQGELKSDVDSVTKKLTGEASLSDFIASKLEKAAREEGESVNFTQEVEPWLGDRGGASFERVEGGELSEPLIAVETTNANAAQAFIDKQTAAGKSPAKAASYEGVDFKVGGPEDNAVGLIGNTLVLADSEKEFKATIDASDGESLGGEDRFQKTMGAASNGSFADVYIDLGGIVKQTEGETDVPTKEALQAAGIDPSEATAVASVIPHSDQIEINVSSELSGEKAPSGDASKLLGSLPASSFAALGFGNFSEMFEEAVDSLDEEGIPPDLEPGELKSALAQAGIDIDKIAASLGEAAVFAEGTDQASLGGAMVVTTESGEAADAIGSLGALLRAANIPGITAVSGKASGFSIGADSLGKKALVIVGKGDRIAIGYGLAQAIAGLNAGSGPTLAGTSSYKAAVAALGKTPISGFVDGSAALQLAEAIIPRSKSEFWEAAPYLKKISYVGIASGSNGELATAKLIAGIGK
jgi:Protein of unknown function (DUF3352)